MLSNFGFGSLAIAFLVSIYGTAAAIYGARRKSPAWIESARLSMLLTWPLITLAAFSLVLLMLTNQFQVSYVYQVTSTTMPTYLKITALWGGQQGSLLLWCWLMAAFASAVTLRKWDRDSAFLPWVIVTSLVTLAFFLGLILFSQNPFTRYWIMPDGRQAVSLLQPAGAVAPIIQDGNGLNPLLRHPGMIIHPPMLYLGFVSFVIPFAFAIAALVTGRTDDRWIRITRRWTLVAWLFLSLGLVLGARWAYDVLGWGGFWGWDPVEISAFMPWLTGTAFLHSVMIQEKRGLFKRWNMILIIITYSLVIIGTFLTRSGMLSSVHAFAQSDIGPVFLAFIGVTFAISLGLLLWRWGRLDSEGQMTSLLSRESLFLVNNLLFVGIAVVCFWGVFYPIISELFTGQKVTVGPPFYTRATGPLFAALLLLMGVAPLSAWGRSTYRTLGRNIWKPFAVSLLVLAVLLVAGMRSFGGLLGFWLAALVLAVTVHEFWRAMWARHRRSGEGLPSALLHLVARNRRRYGGYTIHLGVVFMALGIIGMNLFQTQTQGTVAAGQSLQMGQYVITYKSLAQFPYTDGRTVTRAVVDISRNGKSIGEVYPRQDYYPDSQENMTIPGVRSSAEGDVYVILVGWEPVSSQGATFKIYDNPLINWLWFGAFVFIFGTLIAAWPDKEPETAQARVPTGIAVKQV